MKKIILFVTILLLIPITVQAQRGCCSSKGGVCGCSADGRVICCRGGYSPSCHCTPEYTPTPSPSPVYWCTDSSAINYDSNATVDNGGCIYPVKGCTDSKANNYNANANTDDGSCNYDVLGCTDKKAKNYNKEATKDDGSCIKVVKGCMDPEANNYNPEANTDNKSCKYDPKEEDIILDDLEEEKEQEEPELQEEDSIETKIDKSTEDSPLPEEIIGLLALSGGIGGYGLYKKKKEEERKKQKGLKKLLSKFKKKRR